MADTPPAGGNEFTPQAEDRQQTTPGSGEVFSLGGIEQQKIGHPDLRKWSRKRARERNRQFLSLASFLLLAAVVMTILVTVVIGQRTWDELSGVTAALLPAVSAVATAALTFYFTKKDGG